MAIGANLPHKYVKQWDNSIVSLRNNSEMSGSFFLGTGTIGETQYYYYYKDLGDGKYKHDKVAVWRTTIQETDTVSPCFEMYEDRFTKDYSWLIPEAFALNRPWKCTLVVPKGTIIKEFKLK